MKQKVKRKITFLAIYFFCLAVLVAGRGWWLATIMGGRYPISSLIFDVLALALLMGLLLLISRGVRWGLTRLIGEKKLLVRVLQVAIIVVLVFPFILTTAQLHPQRIASRGTPRDNGLDYRPVAFQSDGLRLSGWHIPAEDESKPIVLIAHGLNANKENFLLPAQLLHSAGHAVFLFDFRGHGDSQGRTVTFGIKEARDVKAAYDWLAAAYPSRPIYALGYSMGGAAVIRAAAEYGIFERIALDSTFSSTESVAKATVLRPFGPFKAVLWQLGRFWAWVWTGEDFAEHQPAQDLARLKDRSILLIHGTADGLIPHTETLRLQDSAARNAELWLVEGANHVQSIMTADYQRRLAEFFGMPDAGNESK
jgi:fermentation-respiration switch protein FrsA (DUF1100 family)